MCGSTSSTITYDNNLGENQNYDYFLIFIIFLCAWRFFLSIYYKYAS